MNYEKLNPIRLQVIIIAHEFSPSQGSECAEGWNIVTRLAKYHDVTVLYASENQFGKADYYHAINKYQAVNGKVTGLTFINIDQPGITKYIAKLNFNFKFLGSIGFPLLYFIGYKYWQRSVYRKAQDLCKNSTFDIIHQLTQITFREPGYLWKLEIPFIWGPTGGLETLKKPFYNLLSFKESIIERVRTLSNFYQITFSHRIRKAMRRAKIIYTFSEYNKRQFQKYANGEIKLLLDSGTGSFKTKQNLKKTPTNKIIGVWCGQLIERKALIILLKALALDDHLKDLVLIKIIGEGPLKSALQRQAEELDVHNIDWLGSVQHSEVFEIMCDSDFFIHTSYREATSNVIPEAISAGLPVICHDISGMGIAIDSTCGIKVPLISPEISIKSFSLGIKKMVTDKCYLEKLKHGALIKANELTWDFMAETIAKDYLKVVN